MATSLRELIVSVSADTTKYQREMDRASRMGGQYFRSVQQGGADASRSWDRQTSAARTHANELDASTQAISRYAAVAAGAFSVGALIGMADDWGQISARIRIATTSQEEFALAQTRLMEIANRTYRDYNEAADQFAGTAQSMREMGFAASDTLDSAEALGLALVAGGSNAQRGAAANDAWAKSMVQGRIATDQFQTLLLQTPRVIQALGEGLGKTTQELQQMAKDGQLTANVVVPAITSQMGKLRAEVESMPTTVQDAGIRFRNELRAWVGGQNEATGATQVLVRGIEGVTSNLEALITIGGAAGLGMIAGKMVQIGAATAQAAISAVQSRAAVIAEAVAMRDATAAGLAKAQADLRRAQAAMTATRGSAESGRQSRALASALLVERQATLAAATAQVNYARATNLAAAAGRGALAILGGPAGLALTLGTVAAGWLLFRGGTDDASQALVDFSGAADTAIEKFSELNAQQQAGQLLRLDDQITESTRAVEQAIERMVSAASAFGSNDMLAPYLDQIRALQAEFGAGRISADELSERVAALNQEVLKGSPAAQAVGRDFVQMGERLATSAREADRKRGLMATLTQTNTETGNSAATAAGKYDQQAGAIRGVGQAAVDVDAQLRSLDSRLNAQIVNLVRLRDGAEKAMMVEIGQQINSAGGVGALSPQQRAAFNEQIAAQRRVMQQTEAAQEAAKAASASDKAGAKSGDQWRDYNTQMERAIGLQQSLAVAYGQGEAAVAASNRQHEIEEQVLRFGEARRTEITAAIEREAKVRAYAEGEQQVAALERQMAMYGLVGEAAKMAYETAAGSLAHLSEAQKKALNEGAAWLEDMAALDSVRDKVRDEYAKKEVQRLDSWSVFADQAARNVQSTLGEGMYSVLDGKFSDIGDSFANMIKRISAELAASKLWEMVGGALAGYGGEGAWGNILRSAGGYMQKGAGKAGGGHVRPHSMQDVTEHGPEILQYGGRSVLMMGATGGVVSPLMNKAGGGAGGARGKVEVSIENKGQGMQIESSSAEQKPDGTLLIRMITNTWKQAAARGEFDGDMSRNFGMKRMGAARG